MKIKRILFRKFSVQREISGLIYTTDNLEFPLENIIFTLD